MLREVHTATETEERATKLLAVRGVGEYVALSRSPSR